MSRSQALRVRLTWRLGIAGSPSNSVLRLLLVPVEASSLVPPYLVSPCRLWGVPFSLAAWGSLSGQLPLSPALHGRCGFACWFRMPCFRGWLSGSSAVPATRGVQQHGWGVRGSGLRRRWGALPLALLHGRRLFFFFFQGKGAYKAKPTRTERKQNDQQALRRATRHC